MDKHLNEMLKILDTGGRLTAHERGLFGAVWKPFSAPRKTVITAQGQLERHLYFVIEGLQRICHYGEDGRESTLVFTYAPSFGGIIDAFFLQTRSNYTYETLTNSRFLRASFEDITAIMLTCPGIVNVMHHGAVQALGGVMERMVELQSYTSEEKFRLLLQRSPHILKLVPHKYLANYIGIDPTNFSKLLNRVII
jgi:CRP-like cAMP-binding protein